MAPMRSSTLLLCALALLASCRSEPLPEPVNIALPRAVDGRPFSFLERKGDATVVFFFSTWCVPCQAMEPFVAEVARRGAREGVEVVGVALDKEGNKTVAPYVLATDPPYPVVLGGGAIAEGRSPFGRIPELPAVIFLDGEGRPAAALTGVADTDMLLERAREVRSRTR
jgi:thiol-disulfide isomerase/thioredoxin